MEAIERYGYVLKIVMASGWGDFLVMKCLPESLEMLLTLGLIVTELIASSP
jgi:hypothetical protein